MTDKEHNTEKSILESAKRVFLRRGFDGARMQEIADEAGINKALLHYYFRSKDKLFDAIFLAAFEQLLPKVAELMVSEKPFMEKIWGFVEHYIEMLLENPQLPIFILSELSRDPDRIVRILGSVNIKPDCFLAEIQKQIDEGAIKPIDPRQLIVNMVSLCVFPFAGKPLMKAILFNGEDDRYKEFLQQRKTEVTLFIINAIKAD